MQRRNAIKKILLVTGNVISLPWWMGCVDGDTPATHQSSFSSTEQELLAVITDTLIPAGNSVGALSMGVDKFLQKLIDDCYEKPVQDNVKAQLKSLNALAKKQHEKSFSSCTKSQREQLLTSLSTSTDAAIKDFYKLLRSETIRGFSTSKEVMLKYNNYKIAPGHYYGCVDIKA